MPTLIIVVKQIKEISANKVNTNRQTAPVLADAKPGQGGFQPAYLALAA